MSDPRASLRVLLEELRDISNRMAPFQDASAYACEVGEIADKALTLLDAAPSPEKRIDTAADYLRDLAERLLDEPTTHYKEAYKALIDCADAEPALLDATIQGETGVEGVGRNHDAEPAPHERDVFRAGWDACERDRLSDETEDIADAPDVAYLDWRKTTLDAAPAPPDEEHYIPERDGRRCVDHPKGDHELVCLTCMEASLQEDAAPAQGWQEVLQQLVSFQAEYARKAYEPGHMPGNEHYSDKAMAIVNAAHQALHGTPVDVEAQRRQVDRALSEPLPAPPVQGSPTREDEK